MNTATVLFTIDLYHVGGITSFIRQYATALINNDYKVVILGGSGDLDNPRDFFKGCIVEQIPKPVTFSFRERLKYTVLYLYYLHRIFSRYKINCIHTSTIWSTFYTFIYYKTWTIPKIATFYGAYYLEMNSQSADVSFINTIIYRLVQGIQYISHIKVVVFSEYSKKIFLKSFPWIKSKKLILIPGLIMKPDIVKSHPKYSNRPVSASHEPFKLLCICRAEPRKGVLQLLQAAYLLKNKKFNFFLEIISPVQYFEWFGIYKEFRKLKLQDCVRLSHAVVDHDRYERMNKADLFIMPSQDYETFGMTLIECMARGLPVIGTPVGAIPEILSRVNSNLITKTKSPDDIAGKIIWYLNLNHRIKCNISKNAIIAVRKFYLLDNYYKQILNLYSP